MKRFLNFAILALLILSILPVSILAQEKPIQLSLFNPIQLFPEDNAITGLRLNLLYGKNNTVVGLDLGLVNQNTSGVSKGYQTGLVGLVDADFMGWQNNIVNIVKGSFEGYQLGVVNHSDYASGVQLGLVNYARTLKGLQIGLVNIIGQGGQFPVFPIVNWSF